MNRKMKKEIFRLLSNSMADRIQTKDQVRTAELDPSDRAILRMISTPKTLMPVPSWLRRQAY